jgi:2,4-didehydro-3-deoxy-L-rhamnonate hydrolase
MAPFTLATLQAPHGPHAAVGVNDHYYLVSDALPSLVGVTVLEMLQDWSTFSPILQTIATEITNGSVPATPAVPASKAELLTPAMYPNKLLAVGANYTDHLKEMGLAAEKWKSMPFFLRPPTTSLVGPGETVRIPRSTKQFDWECELEVVLGKRLRHASREEAAQAIAGYTIGLDLSCRDLIPADNDLKIDLMRGKAQDTMAPCGPYIVPAQFVPDVSDMKISLSVNGKTMMDASTSLMLYKCDEQLSIISEYITLEPGDILFTGSPSGSAGVHGGCWLKPGDRIRAQIGDIGPLEVCMRSDE